MLLDCNENAILCSQKTKNHCISQFTVHTWTYVAVGHCVCLVNCELGCEIGSHPYCYCYCYRLPLTTAFFSQKWHPNFWLFLYNYNRRLLPLWVRSAFALGSLWVRSAFAPKSGGKGYSKRYEIDFTITIYRIENWLARRMAKGSLLCNMMIMRAIDGIGRGCRRVMCGVYCAVD